MHLLVAVKLLCRKLWTPEANLAQPIAQDGQRDDDQMGPRQTLLQCERGEQRDALQRLACGLHELHEMSAGGLRSVASGAKRASPTESHLVGKDAVLLATVHGEQPVQTLELRVHDFLPRQRGDRRWREVAHPCPCPCPCA